MNQTTTPAALDLDKLEALALAATPGPWLHRHDPGNPAGVQHGVKLLGEFGAWVCDCLDNADRSTDGGVAGERNAAFIAAANPATILALIDLARRSSSAAGSEQDERTLFEAEMERKHNLIESDFFKDPLGDYVKALLHYTWNGWQARAAIAQRAASATAECADALHSKIVQVLGEHRMVRMFEVEDDGALGNSYPLIDRLCLDDGADIESGEVEVDAIAWAIVDSLTQQAAPEAPADNNEGEFEEPDHGETVLRVQEALGITRTGWVSPDVILHRIEVLQRPTASAQPVAAAPVAIPDVLDMVLDVVSLAYDAMDGTEENENGLVWDRASFEALSEAMVKLDDLPDDQPGYVMGPAAKARWAMRAPAAPVAQADNKE